MNSLSFCRKTHPSDELGRAVDREVTTFAEYSGHDCKELQMELMILSNNAADEI